MANHIKIDYKNGSLISAGDMSADIASPQIDLTEAEGYSVQISWSGTSPVGVLKLQGSHDGVLFSDILDAFANVSGNTGDGMFNVSDLHYKFARLYYDFTSGTGTLTASLILRNRKS